MTSEEERKNDRKILAECRAWKRAVSKEIAGMSSEEMTAHFNKAAEEARAEYESRTGRKWGSSYCGIKPPPGYPGADLFDTINS
ncbi:hypothetical protein AGMMS4952_08430 [Spirochaetia bacterium]|nr:hypothetical protein AGMMS4952_08430 [Spirochaetia bacterium]